MISVATTGIAESGILFLSRRATIRCPGDYLMSSQPIWQIDIVNEEVFAQHPTAVLKEEKNKDSSNQEFVHYFHITF
jgi:hypothetical protein